MAEEPIEMGSRIDLGGEHTLERVTSPGEGDRHAGYILRHPSAVDKSPCGSFLAFSAAHSSPSAVIVTVQSEEPLTLAPAPLVCPSCGDSGTVEEGKWTSNPPAAVAAEPAGDGAPKANKAAQKD